MLLTDEIRQRLATAIKKQGFSNYRIAKELHISATTLSNYLEGKVNKADNTKIEAICRLLDISLQWLLTGQDMIKMPSDKNLPENEVPVDLKEVVKRIFLMLQARNDQYLSLHKDVDRLRHEFSSFKQEISKLSQK